MLFTILGPSQICLTDNRLAVAFNFLSAHKGFTMFKFSLEVLERCVFPFTETEDPDVILGAAFGEDG